MLWIHYIVSVGFFRQVWYKSAGDFMINTNKSPKISYPAMVKKMKSDPESTRKTGSPPKLNHC